jgi:hypothetical protein
MVQSKQDLKAMLLKNYEDFAEYVENQDITEFENTPNGKWSSGQNLDHLYRAIRPVNLGLRLPKFFPKLLFGKSNRLSKTYDVLVAKYQSKLQAGAVATGVFIPPIIPISKRAYLLKKLRQERDTMIRLMDKWTERELDTLLLPHPILGKLTVREMLFFTIYHAEHHLEILKKRKD